MRLIVSPAKKMRSDSDSFAVAAPPQFLEQAEELKTYLQTLDYDQCRALWRCNDAIAALNFERVRHMDLRRAQTPALFSYDGIQYRYMAPNVFSERELSYVQEHLRILSGFYGLLRPFDGVEPYRMEMQAKLAGFRCSTLYEFWGASLAEALAAEDACLVNLASAMGGVYLCRGGGRKAPGKGHAGQNGAGRHGTLSGGAPGPGTGRDARL